jgi:hypothetical protein
MIYQATVRAAAPQEPRGVFFLVFVSGCSTSCAASLTVPESRFLTGLGGLLCVDGSLLTHGSKNDDVCYFISCVHSLAGPIHSLVSLPSSVNILLILSPISPSGTLTSSFVVPSSDMRERKPSSVTSSWCLSASVVYVRQGCTHELVLLATDVGDVHVVGGRAQLFQLLASEDVNGDQMDLGVAVLARLGGGHFDDLAGTVLDDDEAVLPQCRALHGVRSGGTGIGALERVLMLYMMRLACARWRSAQRRLDAWAQHAAAIDKAG